jgi:hypothetical protein
MTNKKILTAAAGKPQQFDCLRVWLSRDGPAYISKKVWEKNSCWIKDVSKVPHSPLAERQAAAAKYCSDRNKM